jgi:hypothetical protein
MIKISRIVVYSALALALVITPAAAKVKTEDVAGAIALLGIAALSHHHHHYRDGYEPQGSQQVADFERGYRDGLHNAAYNPSRSSASYGQGFDAGHQERANRLPHHNAASGSESEGPNVPPLASSGCAAVVAGNFGVGKHDVHITRTLQRGPNDFLVEAAVGHKYMTCVMGDDGAVVDVTGGRMQR